MSQTTQQELQAARARFAAIVNSERAKIGLAPVEPLSVEKPVDEYMERWKRQGAGNQTNTFIQMNAERISRGELPLGAAGQVVGETAVVAMPPPPVAEPMDDFFSTPVSGKKIAKQG